MVNRYGGEWELSESTIFNLPSRCRMGNGYLFRVFRMQYPSSPDSFRIFSGLVPDTGQVRSESGMLCEYIYVWTKALFSMKRLSRNLMMHLTLFQVIIKQTRSFIQCKSTDDVRTTTPITRSGRTFSGQRARKSSLKLYDRTV